MSFNVVETPGGSFSLSDVRVDKLSESHGVTTYKVSGVADNGSGMCEPFQGTVETEEGGLTADLHWHSGEKLVDYDAEDIATGIMYEADAIGGIL